MLAIIGSSVHFPRAHCNVVSTAIAYDDESWTAQRLPFRLISDQKTGHPLLATQNSLIRVQLRITTTLPRSHAPTLPRTFLIPHEVLDVCDRRGTLWLHPPSRCLCALPLALGRTGGRPGNWTVKRQDLPPRLSQDIVRPAIVDLAEDDTA